MSVKGCDTAQMIADPAALRALGYGFVGRYFGPGSGPKLMTAAELRLLGRARMRILALAEGATTSDLLGRATGRDHAGRALLHLHQLGLADDRVIVSFAADHDTTAANLPAVLDYFRGVNDVLPLARVGVYGDDQAIVACHDNNLASFYIKSAARAWDAGAVVPDYVDLIQGPNGVAAAGNTVDVLTGPRTPRGLITPPPEAAMLRYLFVNFPDLTADMPGFGRVHCTDGVRYRIESKGKTWQDIMGRAGAPVPALVDGNVTGGTYAVAVATLCGMPDHEGTNGNPVALEVTLTGVATPAPGA